jgi:hypothetical protein
MALFVAALLVPDADIPHDVRQAIVEGRPSDAGRRLMELYELTCDETAALLETSCD